MSPDPPDKQEPPNVPRLALSKSEAARALGVSDDFFDKHIAPEVPSVRRGRRRIYSVTALQAWLESAACKLPV